jgi:hypothetical protein
LIHLLCRNRVSDYDRWKAVFDSHADAHRAAGLVLRKLWRSTEDPDEVFFLFSVESVARAREFMNAPDSAAAGPAAGVLDGDYHFIADSNGYPA